MRTALDTDRVHHAYLFTGPAGVGKFLTARTLAAVVNCERRPEHLFQDACGVCRSCQKIAEWKHPDILRVAPEKDTIKIEQIRQVQKASNRAPFEARVRFVLIDDAHTMSDEAANALLKTLEEPSGRMRLILVTDQPHRLLETIWSRCQVIRFGELNPATVLELLEQLLAEKLADMDAKEPPLDRGQLEVAAGYGEGSVGRSLAVIESGMLEGRVELIGRVINLAGGNPVALLDLAEEIRTTREQMQSRLDVLLLFFRDVMLYKAAPSTAALVNRDLQAQVDAVSARFAMADILEIIDRIRQAQRLLLANVNAQLIAEDLLAQVRQRRA